MRICQDCGRPLEETRDGEMMHYDCPVCGTGETHEVKENE